MTSDDNGYDLSGYNFARDGFSYEQGDDWKLKLAYRYRKVKQTYNNYKSSQGG